MITGQQNTLIQEVACLAAWEVVDIFASVLRDDEIHLAFDEAFVVIQAAIEVHAVQSKRLQVIIARN